MEKKPNQEKLKVPLRSGDWSPTLTSDHDPALLLKGTLSLFLLPSTSSTWRVVREDASDLTKDTEGLSGGSKLKHKIQGQETKDLIDNKNKK